MVPRAMISFYLILPVVLFLLSYTRSSQLLLVGEHTPLHSFNLTRLFHSTDGVVLTRTLGFFDFAKKQKLSSFQSILSYAEQLPFQQIYMMKLLFGMLWMETCFSEFSNIFLAILLAFIQLNYWCVPMLISELHSDTCHVLFKVV